MKLNWLRNSVMLTHLVSLVLRITSADRPMIHLGRKKSVWLENRESENEEDIF